jgi:hypothetical protein
MLPPFDIFKREPNEEVLWVKSAETFKAARVAVQELMAASPREYIIFSHRTNNRLVVKPARPSKRREKPLIFQIAYDALLMASRSQLLEADGFTTVSVLGNDAAKAALETPHNYSLFLVGHGAPRNIRKQMVDWLKARYPKVPILALNPPYEEELQPADYNLVLNGPEEWLFIVEAAAA